MPVERTVSPDELHSSDGLEGRPAYVAYQGVVYDVSASRLWRTGMHVRRHHAGNDLTLDFAAAPHDESVLQRVPRVGTLARQEPETPAIRPSLLDLYFGLHPHPVAVHFPVALAVVVAVFLLTYLLTGDESFDLSACYLLWAAAIMTPPAMCSGFVSWWFNYGRILDNRFKVKIGASLVLLSLEVIALILRVTHPTLLLQREPLGWVYAALILLVVLHVALLGWIGARIVFPPRKTK